MLDPHTSAAIAQIVFYVPMVPCTLYFCVRNWSYRPRTAWYPPVPFSLIRLVGAILVILYKQDPKNQGLLIATIVILNLGLIPLMLTFLGLTRVVVESSFKDHGPFHKGMIAIRYLIVASAGLLSTAGGFAGQPDRADLQATLSRVAYFLFLVVILALSSICIWFLLNQNRLKPGDIFYTKWTLLAAPFMLIRAAYGLGNVFAGSGNQILTSIWSPLFGSAVLFSLMALLPEYIALVIYQYLAYRRFQAGRAEALELSREHRRKQRYHTPGRGGYRRDEQLELGSDDVELR